jgi:hypothetical protein
MRARLQVDISQIQALLGREGSCGRTHAGHPIQLFVHASIEQEAAINVRYRVEPNQTERRELMGLLNGGKHSARKLKRARFCWLPTPGPATRRSRGASGLAARPSIGLSAEPRPGADRKLPAKRRPCSGRDGLFGPAQGPRPQGEEARASLA